MENKPVVKNIHSGHRKRVRANVCKNGFSQLEDHKLLELLLFYSIPQADTNELAHRLLNEFGSLDELVKTDVERLKRVDGIGENTAVLIATIGEMYLRVSKEKLNPKKTYTTVDDFKSLAQTVLAGETVEKVYIFCLDVSGKLKKAVLLSSGDEGSAYVDMKKALQAVMDCNAKNAFLAHNHPQGVASPSAFDIDSTRGMCVMFRKLGFFLVDHIVVGSDGSTYSMYEDKDFAKMFS